MKYKLTKINSIDECTDGMLVQCDVYIDNNRYITIENGVIEKVRDCVYIYKNQHIIKSNIETASSSSIIRISDYKNCKISDKKICNIFKKELVTTSLLQIYTFKGEDIQGVWVDVCKINIEVKKIHTQITKRCGCFSCELIYEEVNVCDLLGRRFIVNKKSSNISQQTYDYDVFVPQDLAIKILAAVKLGDI